MKTGTSITEFIYLQQKRDKSNLLSDCLQADRQRNLTTLISLQDLVELVEGGCQQRKHLAGRPKIKEPT